MAEKPATEQPAQAALALEPAAAGSADPVVAAEPAAAAAPAAEPAAAAAAPVDEPKVELTSDKPSMLDSFGKDEPKADAKADDKPAAREEPKADAKADAKSDDKPSKADAKAAKADEKAAKTADEPKKADEPAKADAKADAKPAEDQKPVASFKADDIKFEMPEGLKADDALLGNFRSALVEAVADPSTSAQKLIGMHHDAMKAYDKQVIADQHKAFNTTRDGWRKDVMADEEIGGSGHQTAMTAIARMRDQFVPEAERPAFEQFLRVTGAGDHPQFLKLLHRAARMIDEPGLPPENPKPPPDIGKQNGARRSTLYDHPRSNSNRQ